MTAADTMQPQSLDPTMEREQALLREVRRAFDELVWTFGRKEAANQMERLLRESNFQARVIE